MKAANKLAKVSEFRELLESYKPGQEALALLAKTRMTLLIGPTAAGRNTLINILVETGRYHYIVSDTTRNPRVNNGIPEQNGREYWFLSEDEFLDRIRAGRYLEAEVIHNQQVSGTGVDELAAAAAANETPISEIEPKGAAKISNYSNNILFIFLLPPDFDTWMSRLKGRGEMRAGELNRRLISAEKEIKEALNSDIFQFVINFEIHEAAEAVDELTNGRELDAGKQALGRRHGEKLIRDIQKYLGQV